MLRSALPACHPFLTLWAIAILQTALLPLHADMKHPHVLIILVDDMGYGDPGCFNPQSRIPTPNIDALATRGMRFTDAHASGPLCHLSRYGLMTGEYPFRIDPTIWPTRPLIKEDQPTIASWMKQAGYRTAMIGKWHCGFHERDAKDRYAGALPGGPVDVGFDSFFGMRASTDIPPYFYIRDDRAVTPPTDEIPANHSEGWSDIQGAFWRAGAIATDLQLDTVLPRLTEEAIRVIKSHAPNEAPLMLYLALPAPHTPWLPSREFANKSRAGMYGDFMVMVDAMVGRVLAALEESRMADDTLVIFTSDNGPVWYPSDVQRFDHDASGGWRGMKADAWEAGHRMPLIARWPGKVRPGATSDRLISFVDLFATFAELVDQPLRDDQAPDSFSFLKELLGQPSHDRTLRKTLAIKSGNGAMMLRDGKWKLIDRLGSGGFSRPRHIKPQPGDPQGQLYDLSTDPGETRNVYAENPEIVARLTRVRQQIEAQSHRRLQAASADR